MTVRHEEPFAAHPQFTAQESAVYSLEGFDFEAWVRVGEDEVVLVEELPMLDAAVEGETVAPVVEDGWYETFERRVEDVTSLLQGDLDEPKVARDGDRIRVEIRIEAGEQAPDDAIAAANYVEGTWVEGIIPGYTYNEAVQAIRNRAQENAEGQP